MRKTAHSEKFTVSALGKIFFPHWFTVSALGKFIGEKTF
jgi:hypothetical protein